MTTRVSAARTELPNKPHALYRFFDRTDALLYVGISLNLPNRISSHRRTKDWWTQVAYMSVEHFATRREALDAEAEAIRTECPLHNDTHNFHVLVDDGLPKPGEVTGKWLLENWPSVQPSIKAYVEMPAWYDGRYELADEILSHFTEDEVRRYLRLGRFQGEIDEEADLDGPEAKARAVAAAVRDLQSDVACLSISIERLVDFLPFDQVQRAIGDAYDSLTADGREATDIAVQVAALVRLTYEMAATHLAGLTEEDRDATLRRIEASHPGIGERDLVVEAATNARAREAFGLSLRSEPGE